MHCITCNHEHEENYCPNCGEKNGVKKISLSSIFEDAFSTITNMDKGFLFNIKNLIVNPKKITLDYLQGKRRGILNPMSYLIISVTIYLIVLSIFKVPKELVEARESYNPTMQKFGNEVGLFLRTNIKYFWILSIIPLGLALKIAYRKYNYVEHLAISSFIIGQATLGGIISYMIFKFPLIFDPFVYGIIALLIYKIYKTNNERIESILVSSTVLFLFVIQLILITVVLGIIKYYGEYAS